MSEWYERVAHPFIPQKKGRVVYLNGTSSSGKSTVAKGLRHRLIEEGRPIFYASVDDFGFMITATNNVKELLADFDVEAEWPKICYAFNRIVPSLTEAGSDVIVDNVFHGTFWAKDAVSQLKEENVLFIGVFCEGTVNDERERARGDRPIGMAAFQRKETHAQCAYDLTVDTCAETTDESVEKILDEMKRWEQHDAPFTGIKKTWRNMQKT